jgi:hypothetical protein
MKLNSQDLEKIADLKLDYYNRHAEDFWEGTRNHDISQNIAAMLRYIESERPFTILDFGCAPGRDLKAFTELGHLATGLEGAAHLAAMARAYSGCECGNRIFSSSIYPTTISMAYSPTLSCFMSPARSCRACC